MSAPTIRAEVAAAVRAANAAFNRLAPEQQDQVEIVADDLLDDALRAGDRGRALEAIATWKRAQLAAIEAVAR